MAEDANKEAQAAKELEAQKAKEAEASAKAKAEADAKAKEEAEKNGKVGNIFKKKGEGGKTVPEAVFLEEKKARKELEKKLKEMEDSGASKAEIADSIKEIADKYDVEPALISEIASAIKKETGAEIDEKISKKMKPIEDKENEATVEKIFSENYEKTLAENPEFKNLANRAVIKSLTLDPKNAEKTFLQILQEAYGHLVKSIKKPIEGVRPKDGGSNVQIDFARAAKDKEYYAEIMADPQLKAEYNKDLHKRLKL